MRGKEKSFVEHPISFCVVDASDNMKAAVSGEVKRSHMRAQSSENCMKARVFIFPFKDIGCQRQGRRGRNDIKITRAV